MVFLCSFQAKAQFSVTVCQTSADALIATDRNDWAHANLAVVNDGYLHNFEQPEVPCGLANLTLASMNIEINIMDINTNTACTGVPIFGNVLLNCPLTTSAVCPIVQDVLSPACNFGIGATTPGISSLNPMTCGVGIDSNDIIGVDLIPATENLNSCPTIANAVQSGTIELIYEICITFNYQQNVPNACDNTISMPCDDGDPCTENDEIIVDECDNAIICAPCAGQLISSCADTVEMPCDDGDPCTINDVTLVGACDNSFICEPCAGEVQIDCDTTQEIPCDDGNPCTENDVIIASACDDTFICVPCQGEAIADCSNVVEVPCDDGNPCTENDVMVLDQCNNDAVCVPCQGTAITPQNCDDGNCANGFEIWDENTCTCETVESILGCTDPLACNFDPLANCSFECDYNCFDCMGIPFGTAVIDSCGECLAMDDPLLNFSCLSSIFIPNAFSPDGDGINDFFAIQTQQRFDFFEISIYNRLGQEIFSSNEPDFRWFGNGLTIEYYLPSDLYIYVVSFSFDGKLVEKLNGHVSIIR